MQYHYIRRMAHGSSQALTLDRLQQLLKLFVVSPKYDKAPEQLVAFMALLVARDKVTVDNGVYKRKVAG